MFDWKRINSTWKLINDIISAEVYRDKYGNWRLDCSNLNLDEYYLGPKIMLDLEAITKARETIVELIAELYQEVKDYL